MKYGVYCINDIKSGWLSPTIDINDKVAIRNFAFAVQSNKLLYAFSNDYWLFKIGEFDTESGDIINIPHVFLTDAASACPKVSSVTDEMGCDDE